MRRQRVQLVAVGADPRCRLRAAAARGGRLHIAALRRPDVRHGGQGGGEGALPLDRLGPPPALPQRDGRGGRSGDEGVTMSRCTAMVVLPLLNLVYGLCM